MQLIALFRLGFPSAPVLNTLTSLHTITRRSILQKVRGRTSLVLPLLVNTGFQVLFHSPSGVLFTFPSRYYALSVNSKYLALGGGPPCFPQDFSCPAVLWIPALSGSLSCTGLLPSLAALSNALLLRILRLMPVHNPSQPKSAGLGSFPFARHYSGNRGFFLFLWLLRCFSSPGSLLMAYGFSHG